MKNIGVELLFVTIFWVHFFQEEVTCKRFKPFIGTKFSPDRLPKIRLFSYIQQDSMETIVMDIYYAETYQDDFITNNKSEYIVQSSEISMIIFTCEAQYPISWKFPHPDQFYALHESLRGVSGMTTRKSLFDQDMETPSGYDYTTYLVLRAPTFQKFNSVNLTCQSSERSTKKSSVHVYMSDSYSLENQGKTVHAQIEVIDGVHEVVIPCRPSFPDAIVTLYKRSSNQALGGNGWQSIFSSKDLFSSSSLSFDPKIGFICSQRWPTYLESLQVKAPGLKCTIKRNDDDEEDKEDFVFVNITYGKGYKDNPPKEFIPQSRLSGNAHITFKNSTYYSEIKCCSGAGSKPPRLWRKHCVTETECNLVKQLATSIFNDNSASLERYLAYYDYDNDCSSKWVMPSSSMVVICQGENVNFAQQYQTTFKLDKTNYSDSIARLKTELVPYGTPMTLEEGLIIRQFKKIASPTRNELINLNYYPNMTDMMVVYREPPDLTNLYGHVLSKNPLSELQYLGKESEQAYSGEIIHFACFSSPLLYSYGAYFRINWKNNSRTVVDEEKKRHNVMVSPNAPEDKNAITIFSTPLQADVNMESVDCFAPVWNTTGWHKITYHVNVLESEIPQLEGNDVETVYLTLQETGRQISCEVTHGVPTPTIKMTKDGKEIQGFMNDAKTANSNKTMNLTSNQTVDDHTRVLNFSSVTHDMHGVYKCSAKNMKGEAVKVFNVIVVDEANLLLTILMWCFLLLLASVLIFSLPLIYWWRKGRSQA